MGDDNPPKQVQNKRSNGDFLSRFQNNDKNISNVPHQKPNSGNTNTSGSVGIRITARAQKTLYLRKVGEKATNETQNVEKVTAKKILISG